MKDFFPESLGQKRGYALYMAKYSIWGCYNSFLGEETLPFEVQWEYSRCQL